MRGDLIRILVADDHAVVRAGIRALVNTARDMELVSEASNGREAVSLAQRFNPDVVVMDIAMAQLDGIGATKELKAIAPDIRVVVLTMHAEDEYLIAALDAGAAGFLLKSAAERELLDAIRAVAHGDTYVQPTATRALVRELTRPNTQQARSRALALLSERERSVLRMIAEGHSGPAVAEALGISPKTVETYKQRIHEKLGIASRPAIVSFALSVGILGAGGPPASPFPGGPLDGRLARHGA